MKHRKMAREKLKQSKRWVVKIGSALLTNNGLGLNHAAIKDWVEQISVLRNSGIDIVLVSSGAVAEGMSRLNWSERPQALHELQAAAAIGQMGLVQAYESEFQSHDLHTAQILLTHDDLSNRTRYLNARSTLQSLLNLGVVPVVNENDTVVYDEIQFGDNDTLAALVVNLIEADHLIILTDQNGLYDQDPSQTSDAKLISEAACTDEKLDAMVKGKSGSLGRGGMLTKLRAARLAARSGANTIIANGRDSNILMQLYEGAVLGTCLLAEQMPITARKQWLASQLQLAGTITVDTGAESMLLNKGVSLLPVGITKVAGTFTRGDVVACVNSDGKEIARGLVNYGSSEARKLVGVSSDKIALTLGYIDEEEMIHRDNMVLTQ